MSVAEIVDEEVMRHIALFGCVKNADPLVQHMLKTSRDPVLRFRRWWMRRKALQQHLEAERRQKRVNDRFKDMPHKKGLNMRQEAAIDPFLAGEMQHYSGAPLKELVGDIRREAPAIFPRRESV